VEVVSSIRWLHRPKLRRPTLVAAFEGWNDAGDAASAAVRWLADRHGAEKIATIDSEEFFDFTATRPHVQRDDDGERTIVWPDTELWSAATSGASDIVVLVGAEPHLRWRSYCKAVLEVATALDCSMVLTLGALLSDVPHTRPTAVSGSAIDADLIERLDLETSDYQGPTGIVGILQSACHEAGTPAASLWAAVPTYVSGAPSPKAMLALVERSMTMLGLSIPTTDLQIASAAYERQLDELVADDDETAAYVAGLEEVVDAGEVHHPADDEDEINELADTDPEDLVEEVERFLRGD
jgi:proteasome assembly chaperone (PAC2) family protein